MRPLAFARLAGLWAIAVAQPLLNTLARAPEFLVAQRTDALDVLILALLVVVAPPAVAWLGIMVAGAAGTRTRDTVEAVVSGLIAAVLAVQIGYRAGVTGWPGTIAIALVTVAAVTAAWLRFGGIRAFATVLSAAAIVVPAVFLASPGVRAVLWRGAGQVLEAGITSSTPVVLVVFDELPLVSLLDARGAIDTARFPNVARLAADGIWFRNATTSSDFTRWALPAIVSGRRPPAEATPLFHEHPRSLFTLLGASHRIEALEPITALCPPQLCHETQVPRTERLRAVMRDVSVVAAHAFLPPAARADLPSLTANWAGFGDARVSQGGDDSEDVPAWRRIWNRRIDEDHARSALRFVQGIAPGDPQPTLYFMHTLASHHPLRWLPNGQPIASPRKMAGVVRDVWTRDPWPVTLGHQSHLVQAGFVDTIVGRLRTRLESAGIYDEALVIVTSDHGVAFNPGDDLRSLTDVNVGEILPVPLIVKPPAGRKEPAPGTIDDRLVESIDVLPTVADALEIELPWEVDGVSALGRARREAAHVFVRDAKRLRRFEASEIETRRAEALERRRRRFGDGAWPSPRLAGLESLAGTPLESLELAPPDGTLRVHLDRPFALQRVRLDGPLPVQLAGRLEPVERASRAHTLGVALNGTVVAVARTAPGDAGWTALVPPDSLREGGNRVDLFLIESRSPLRATRLRQTARDPRGINLLQASYAEWGVEREGFFRRERSGRRSFRWTSGSASLTVPLRDAARPSTLRIEVASTSHERTSVRVLAGECPLFSGTLPSGASTHTLPLTPCTPLQNPLVLRILSDTYQPPKDGRRLGIALSNVALN